MQCGAWPDVSEDHTHSHLLGCFGISTAGVRGGSRTELPRIPTRVPVTVNLISCFLSRVETTCAADMDGRIARLGPLVLTCQPLDGDHLKGR